MRGNYDLSYFLNILVWAIAHAFYRDEFFQSTNTHNTSWKTNRYIYQETNRKKRMQANTNRYDEHSHNP